MKKNLIVIIFVILAIICETIFIFTLDNKSHAVETYPFLSTNSNTTILNLVNEQGLNVSGVTAVDFIKIDNVNRLNNKKIAYFQSLDNKIIKSWIENETLYFGTESETFEIGPQLTGAFSNATNLRSINMGIANTVNVNLMGTMFYDTKNAKINLGEHFDTSNVISMFFMFSGAGYNVNNFTLNLGNKFNTANTTSMTGMFMETGFKSTNFSINLGDKFDTSKVVSMASMFHDAGQASENFTINLGNKFDTSKVTNMFYMFYNMGKNSNSLFLNLNDKFNISNVTDVERMFTSVGANSKEVRINLGNNFNASKAKDMSYMFAMIGENAGSVSIDLGKNFNPISATNMGWMFTLAGSSASTFTLNLGQNFNTSNVQDMAYMFSMVGEKSQTLSLDLQNNFDTSNVTDMNSMFTSTGANATNFSINLGSKFNTKNVKNMSQMFLNTGNKSNFTLDVSKFNVANVTNFKNMFTFIGAQSVIFSEGWNYSAKLPSYGMASSSKIKNIINAPSAIKKYNWKADGVTPTFLDLNPDLITVSSNQLNVNENEKIISQIKVGSLASYINGLITTNGSEHIITDKNKQEKTGTVATGDYLQVKYAGGIFKYYELSVSGDVNGDSKVDLSDIMKVAKQIYLSNNELIGVYFNAADYNESGDITLSDLMKIAKEAYLK